MKATLFLASVAVLGFWLPTTNKPITPDHVIIVMEENHGYDQLIGSANAPYLNKLAAEGALFTNSHGVTHPSQPNYVAMFSGSTQGVFNDDCSDTTTFNTPNLGASLLKNGLTFAGYAENLPSVGYKGCAYGKGDLTKMTLYARKHAPWVNWQGTGANNIPDSLSKPMTAFPTDFNKLPTVSFVIPDMDNDMHNIGAPGDAAAIKRGDSWLKYNLSKYVEWAKTHNSILIITFDEDDFKMVNHIPTIIVGEHIKAGKYDQKINHYNVLKTIENFYNLSVQDSNKVSAISNIWLN